MLFADLVAGLALSRFAAARFALRRESTGPLNVSSAEFRTLLWPARAVSSLEPLSRGSPAAPRERAASARCRSQSPPACRKACSFRAPGRQSIPPRSRASRRKSWRRSRTRSFTSISVFAFACRAAPPARFPQRRFCSRSASSASIMPARESRMIEASTPLMRQYQSIKKRYPHALLLFRLGDFYELFYEDAIVASRELQITLTSRNRERGEPIPMCGVPFHAAETYIARLLRAGYKIAVCDQMEQPGPGKHLVRREVVRVITPGTATDLNVLEPKENNFLAAVARAPARRAHRPGLSGSSPPASFAPPNLPARRRGKAARRIAAAPPARNPACRASRAFSRRLRRGPSNGTAERRAQAAETRLEEWIFRRDYGERLLTEQFGVAASKASAWPAIRRPSAPPARCCTTCAKLSRQDRRRAGQADVAALAHLDTIRYYEQQDALVLDPVTVRNLELLSPLYADEAPRASQRDASLFGAIDQTATVMGARLLRAWILRPEIVRDGDRSAPRRRRRTQIPHHAARGDSPESARRAGPRAPGQPRHAGRGHAARPGRAAPIPRRAFPCCAAISPTAPPPAPSTDRRPACRDGRTRRRAAAPRTSHRRRSARAGLRSRRHPPRIRRRTRRAARPEPAPAARPSPPWKTANASAPASAR